MALSVVRKLNPRQKLIYTAIGGILICLIIYLTLHSTAASIKELKTKIVDQKISLEKQKNKSESTIRLSDKLKKIEPRLEKFDRIFIKRNRELEFITALEDVADRNKVTQNIELPPPPLTEKKELYGKSTLKINAGGLYSDVINYLTEIESLNYYININNIIIDVAQKSDTKTRRTPRLDNSSVSTDINSVKGNVNIKISAETYWK